MSSGVKVNDACVASFTTIKKAGKGGRYIIFRIGDDKKEIVIDKEELTEGGPYTNFTEALSKDEPRYAVVDFEWKNDDGVTKNDLMFLAWSPDTCSVKPKMLYASSLDAIKKKMDGCKKYIQCNDNDEITVEALTSELKK
jgi:cofilin